jgi:YopT peptidase
MFGTKVLPFAHRIDKHLKMSVTHDELQALAWECNGAMTKKFDQASDNKTEGVGYWMHQRRYDTGETWSGICMALSTYWLKYHATDRDFWHWLGQSGAGFIETRANEIANLQGRYDVALARGVSERNWLRSQLASSGIVEQGACANMLKATTFVESNPNLPKNLHPQVFASMIATAIAPAHLPLPVYKIIGFSGTAGGHATAAWVGTDVCFFDPNFGEFWFETRLGFRKFFPRFFEYAYGTTLSQIYALYAYGRAARPGVR